MTEFRIHLNQLLTGMVEVPAESSCAVTGLALDSRRIRAGEAFVALQGESAHGLEYIDQALAAGAVAVIHDTGGEVSGPVNVPVIGVPGLKRHLPALARRMWADPAASLDLIAVTGTNGKTSVAWLLAQALDGAMVGTLGYGRPGQLETATHTTPDIFSVYRLLAGFAARGIRTVVLEASSHALSQDRLAGLRWSSVIFTTLGHDHLDYHADRAAYGEAKAKLFLAADSQRQLINMDDPFGAALAARLPDQSGLIGYSLAGHADAAATAHALRVSVDGLRAEIRLPSGRFEAVSRLLGRVNVWNLLIVAAELGARGWAAERIAACIADLDPVPGRMQPVIAETGPLAIVDYSHTPDALDNALRSARELTVAELWCVFGCGGDRDRAKRPHMGRIAETLADYVVLTNDNPRNEDGLAIIRAIQSGMQRPDRSRVVPDRAEAIRLAISRSQRGDVVLVAGKGHETEQVVGTTRHSFDDCVAVREALEAAA